MATETTRTGRLQRAGAGHCVPAFPPLGPESGSAKNAPLRNARIGTTPRHSRPPGASSAQRLGASDAGRVSGLGVRSGGSLPGGVRKCPRGDPARGVTLRNLRTRPIRGEVGWKTTAVMRVPGAVRRGRAPRPRPPTRSRGDRGAGDIATRQTAPAGGDALSMPRDAAGIGSRAYLDVTWVSAASRVPRDWFPGPCPRRRRRAGTLTRI